jgi:hypothetical protein
MGNFTGKKFDRSMDIKEVARLVRKDINAAKRAGLLPRSMKISVAISRYSMGCSLSIVVREWPGRVVNPAWCLGHILDPHGMARAPRLTEQGNRWIEALEALANEYNYDRSDSTTDYYDKAFYLGISFGDAEEDERTAQIAELKAVM